MFLRGTVVLCRYAAPISRYYSCSSLASEIVIATLYKLLHSVNSWTPFTPKLTTVYSVKSHFLSRRRVTVIVPSTYKITKPQSLWANGNRFLLTRSPSLCTSCLPTSAKSKAWLPRTISLRKGVNSRKVSEKLRTLLQNSLLFDLSGALNFVEWVFYDRSNARLAQPRDKSRSWPGEVGYITYLTNG